MDVKICGLSDQEGLTAAVQGGARYVGFVFFDKSPRAVSVPLGRSLALEVPPAVCKVALVVNPDDTFLDQITSEVPVDMLQLHGTETPARVAEIKSRYGLPVMKALGVADRADLGAIDDYARVADQLLVDAKPSPDADIPGGNGHSFDWGLLQGRRWAVPWMLAGGLTSQNVQEAARLTGAQQVDASSSVERSRGIKDPQLIAEFLKAAA